MRCRVTTESGLALGFRPVCDGTTAEVGVPRSAYSREPTRALSRILLESEIRQR
jgi:hypothetical protein